MAEHTEPKLRSDAARNREKLLAAGREVFARRGLDATLNDVAHHAGVGVGTAYRRFANKQELIDAILDQQNDELEAILRAALADPDPWAGLVSYLEQSTRMHARDRGMAQIQAGHHARPEPYDRSRDRLAALVNQIADRARDAGALRPDITGTDLIFIQIAVNAIASTAYGTTALSDRDDLDGLHRRYLWILLDGLRAHPGHASDLPVASLTTAQTHTLLQPATRAAQSVTPSAGAGAREP